MHHIIIRTLAIKKTIILSFIWLACLACNNNEDTPKAQQSITSVSYRKLTSVTVSGAPLSVTVLEINDSRCPINADCIAAGSANVKFNITDGTDNTDTVVQLISDEKDKTIQSFKLGSQSYSIKIHEVSPYPEIPKTTNPEDYKVSLTIEKI